MGMMGKNTTYKQPFKYLTVPQKNLGTAQGTFRKACCSPELWQKSTLVPESAA
jgi:hypothetical protein